MLIGHFARDFGKIFFIDSVTDTYVLSLRGYLRLAFTNMSIFKNMKERIQIKNIIVIENIFRHGNVLV